MIGCVMPYLRCLTHFAQQHTHTHTHKPLICFTILSLCTHPALELDAQPLHIKGKPCVVKEGCKKHEGEKIDRGKHEVGVGPF